MSEVTLKLRFRIIVYVNVTHENKKYDAIFRLKLRFRVLFQIVVYVINVTQKKRLKLRFQVLFRIVVYVINVTQKNIEFMM
jgi:hypothetical protein